METSLSYIIPFLLLLLPFIYLFFHRRTTAPGRLPPGPPGWPIIGNLLDLGVMPHRTLTDIRQTYGPVIMLKLGSVKTMVILSASSATEFFKNHDHSFLNRNITETMRCHGYDQGSVALAPYGAYWRVIRRLVTVDMLVNKRINQTVDIRKKCVDNMVLWIQEECNKVQSEGIHVARFVFLTAFNLLGNLMLSKDLVDPKSKAGSDFFESMMRLMESSGYANMADYFPWLKWLDPQGLKRKMNKHLGKTLEIASKFVKERIEEKEKMAGSECGDSRKDFLDVLIEFEGNGKDEPRKISEKDLNILVLEIFMAGSETTSSTIEWAMTELLRKPETMKKAKEELARVIGRNKKLEETDIENLPYLQAITKETLRLHPPIPFLVPRTASQDTIFMGYHIPKHTQVFVNAWAIGRDPAAWTDGPLNFEPERFLDSKVDYKGQNYELIPFGAGRRMCAGVSLAHRVLLLVLGSLLHEFDWKLGGNIGPESVDMQDKLAVTMRKAKPLLAVPKKV